MAYISARMIANRNRIAYHERKVCEELLARSHESPTANWWSLRMQRAVSSLLQALAAEDARHADILHENRCLEEERDQALMRTIDLLEVVRAIEAPETLPTI